MDQPTTHPQHFQTSSPHRHEENSTLRATAVATTDSNQALQGCDNHNLSTIAPLHAHNSTTCPHHRVHYQSQSLTQAGDDRDTARNSLSRTQPPSPQPPMRAPNKDPQT